MPRYAVAKGRQVGIYDNWADCKDAVNGYSGAVFKKFDSTAEAQLFINQRSDAPAQSRSSMASLSSDWSYSAPMPAPRFQPSYRSSNAYSGPAKTEKSNSIYVDGACRGNGQSRTRQAGYGVYYGPLDLRNVARPLSDVEDVQQHQPTNQRAELHALCHALKNVAELPNEKYTVYTDSAYSLNSVTAWSQKWQQNGWRTSGGGEVANRDLIETASKLYSDINSGEQRVRIEHVAGHLGIAGNEAADRLANMGADRTRAP